MNPDGRARVLVVDDEAMIGRVVARLLSREHDVVTATSGREALALVETDAPFDLVLCDLMMPGMSGLDVHAALSERDPVLASRMVFITGGACCCESRAFLGRIPNRQVQKPFDVLELRALVASLVASH